MSRQKKLIMKSSSRGLKRRSMIKSRLMLQKSKRRKTSLPVLKSPVIFATISKA